MNQDRLLGNFLTKNIYTLTLILRLDLVGAQWTKNGQTPPTNFSLTVSHPPDHPEKEKLG